MKTLIQGGTVITAADTIQADVLIEGEKISLIGQNLPKDGAKVIDATGKLVMPGGIDPHTHLELPFFTTVSSDDFYTGHRAAAFGGTTCHIDFANQRKGETLHEALEKWRRLAEGKAVLDYATHMSITDLRPDVLAEIPSLLDEGITSLKVFLSYKNMYMLTDGEILQVMHKAAELGMLVLVHAENGDVVDMLTRQFVAEGKLSPEYHALSHPAWSETEATLRAIALASVANVPLYVVHMTCAGAVDQLTYGRQRGLPVMGETCPQYLFFTEDDLRRPDGAKFICSPPVRTRADNVYLWDALADGRIQVVGTDHCPFLFDGTKPLTYEGEVYRSPGKESGGGDFSKTPNGMHGIEDRMLLLWTYGVGKGRFSANRFVELTATNPAKIFGLYPRKGTIAPGSDADIVIWNPEARKTVSWRTHHMRVDHNVYEGMELVGLPEKVFVRGELVVDGESWYGRRGSGRFLHRQSHAPVV
ncbi:MAG: dihydropyrimidinase [Chloroflexi bacterium]|nr:MAG: dihydropyrimidinase [Chloroflexota bacterium]